MLWESAQGAWRPRTRAGKGTLASLGILVTTVCLEEMGETERRETKGKQVLAHGGFQLPFPLSVHPFGLPHSVITYLLTPPPFTHPYPGNTESLLHARLRARRRGPSSLGLTGFLLQWGWLVVSQHL